MSSGPRQDPADESRVAAGLVVAGKYELLHLLGEGGMGAVWAATHLGLNQTVALKIISNTYANSAEARRRFDQEAKAAARLKSRYVVQVFDNGELPDGTPYMAMELLEGESLGQRLSRGPISLADTAAYLTQMTRALDRAHELGIIHRDIKPENIFLARSHDEESGTVLKVLDFGIAKIASLDSGASHTKTGVLMGTPLFMSPEQARGLKTLDHRSDLYSIGMVVFTMVTGKKAFGGESLVDLVVQVCTYPLPSFAEAGMELPPGLDGWFQRACNRDPNQRFSSGRALSEAFAVAAGLREDAALSHTVLEREVGPIGGLTQSSGPWNLPPTGPTASAVTAASTTPSLHGATRTPMDAPQGRSVAAMMGGVAFLVALVVGGGVLFMNHPQTVPVVDTSHAAAATAPTAPAPTSPTATVSAAPTALPSASARNIADVAADVPPAASAVPTPRAPSAKGSGTRTSHPSKSQPAAVDTSHGVEVGF